MGAGKSSLAMVLADRMGAELLDTDELVVEQAGETIAELFERDGEQAFRTRELAALREALEHPSPVVIATGGGIVTTSEARTLLAEQAGVIFLDVSVPVALERVRRDPASRPKLGADPAASLAKLVEERRSGYQAVASLTLPVGELSLDELAGRILEWSGSRT
jgi:shikimate kinase